MYDRYVLRWVSGGIREHLDVQLVNVIFYFQEGICFILVLQSIGICCIPPYKFCRPWMKRSSINSKDLYSIILYISLLDFTTNSAYHP